MVTVPVSNNDCYLAKKHSPTQDSQGPFSQARGITWPMSGEPASGLSPAGLVNQVNRNMNINIFQISREIVLLHLDWTHSLDLFLLYFGLALDFALAIYKYPVTMPYRIP